MNVAPHAPPQLSPRMRAWNTALTASPGTLDLDVPAHRVDGAVPEALRGGRLLSNGPGWNVIGGVNVHPFDGHGYVRSFAFRRDGAVRVTARFVQTPSYRAESAVGRLVHRGLATNLDGPFYRNRPGGPPRHVANTTITRWNDRLLVGWEGGAPYALDPHTLGTRFSDPFDTILRVDLRDPARPAALWSVPDNTFVGEPVFVPTGDSGTDGYVLALVTHGLEGRTSLCVLDATALDRGPVATVPLPLLPIAFHGDWDAAAPEATESSA